MVEDRNFERKNYGKIEVVRVEISSAKIVKFRSKELKMKFGVQVQKL